MAQHRLDRSHARLVCGSSDAGVRVTKKEGYGFKKKRRVRASQKGGYELLKKRVRVAKRKGTNCKERRVRATKREGISY